MLLRGCGGCSSDFSWPGLLGKELCGRHWGEEHHPARPEGQRVQPPRVLVTLQGCGGHCHGTASAPGEPGLCPASGLWREFSKEAHPKAGWDAQHPSPRGSQGSSLCDPTIWAGGFNSAGALQDSLGTSQGSSPLQKAQTHLSAAAESPNPSSKPCKAEQSLSDCLLTSLRPSDAKPPSEPFCQSDTFRVI